MKYFGFELEPENGTAIWTIDGGRERVQDHTHPIQEKQMAHDVFNEYVE